MILLQRPHFVVAICCVAHARAGHACLHSRLKPSLAGPLVTPSPHCRYSVAHNKRRPKAAVHDHHTSGWVVCASVQEVEEVERASMAEEDELKFEGMASIAAAAVVRGAVAKASAIAHSST